MRFIHIADVHLGACPDHGHPWSRERGKELWESFRRVIETANEKKVDLLLIAGDLFHRPPSPQDIKEVNYLFSTLEKTMVVLIAGNHDYITPGSPYLTYPWADNVVGLFSTTCERVRLPDLKTEIYGFSYDRQEILEARYDNIRAERNDYFKILLAHGGDAHHIPLSKERLAAAGFDYIALGHIHRPQVLIPGLAAYPGALEPIDCDDIGPHGHITGEVHRRKLRFSFTEVGARQYKKITVMLEEGDTAYAIREKIAKTLEQEGREHTYRISLTGNREPQLKLELREYLKCGRILEIEDRTVPAFHLEELKRQHRGQLIGRFIESFDAAGSLVEQKALAYGLEALLAEK